MNRTGAIIGDTLAEQLEQTIMNVGFALEAVEADRSDLLKSTVIFADIDSGNAEDLLVASVMNGAPSPPGVVFSAKSLLEEGVLVEIQVDVAVSESFVRRLM
ncbi:RutC-like protein [Gracilaria domingensis]|nr:RutC-like protein [Gracilaria domingensis]